MHKTWKIKDRAACALPKTQQKRRLIIGYISEALCGADLSLPLQKRAIQQSRLSEGFQNELRFSFQSCTSQPQALGALASPGSACHVIQLLEILLQAHVTDCAWNELPLPVEDL